ncbi:MAG: SH3 domain-containing protein [Dehalococcoidia bacterium]|nr:MAG: SH3 domain-containing protein [Dehalococcoidia bacterium]
MTRKIRILVLLFAGALLACSTLSTLVSNPEATFAGGTATPAAAVPALPPSSTPLSPIGEGGTLCAQVIANTTLHIRTAPDPNAEVIGWLLTGQIVEITGAPVNNWLPVRSGKQTSWSNAAYLQILDCH